LVREAEPETSRGVVRDGAAALEGWMRWRTIARQGLADAAGLIVVNPELAGAGR
jgi:hypothetical protein